MSKREVTLRCGGVHVFRVGDYMMGSGKTLYRITSVAPGENGVGTVTGVEASWLEKLAVAIENAFRELKYRITGR